jgi:hypothetical protein
METRGTQGLNERSESCSECGQVRNRRLFRDGGKRRRNRGMKTKSRTKETTSLTRENNEDLKGWPRIGRT